MNNKRLRFKYLLICLLVLLTGVNMGCSGESKEQPEEAMETPAFSSRFYLDLNADRVVGLQKGDTLSIPVNDSTTVQLIIRRTSRPMEGVFSVSADIEKKETGTASLVVQEGYVAGNMNIFAQDQILYIRYDSLKNQHFIRSVPKEDLEILEGDEPLKPPVENGN